MVFSSLTFVLFFFPLVLVLYFISKNARYRNAVLLVFSLVFYAWGEPKWIFAMLVTVIINYLSALIINRSKAKSIRTVWMIIGVGLSLGFLFYFKYCGFALDTLSSLFGIKIGFNAPVLPIGISFYTFQVLTYTIDVYKGKTKVQKSFPRLLLYVSFFPQLIAGPIVNYSDIAGYLEKRTITFEDFYEGFQRFFIGFAKKILIANTCGIITEKVIAVDNMSVMSAWLLAIAYALQIYFDFSGYSDMAIGIGRMFGFKFLENFNYPYISKSITEFWRRWHISLGSFFREYVYIPLGGNRGSKIKLIRNLLIVWMLTGVWHGASWNFILWGLYYGILLILEKFIFLKVKEKIPAFINIIMTLILVLIGWVLFYYIDLSQAIEHLGVMFCIIKRPLTDATAIYYFKYYIAFIIIGAFACIPWKALTSKVLSQDNVILNKFISTSSMYLKPIIVTILFLASLGVLIGQSYNPFLYFRF